MTVEAETKNRAEVWAEAQRARTVCPECGKHLSVRTLRWKHICRDRTPRERRPRILNTEQAEERRRALEELAAAALRFRLSGRGPASGIHELPQGSVT
jgi:hypothetical protein